ncbi:MAG: type VI secretion system baseplate subunit TssF [Desulfobacteraceae bacterium]|nr:type VI secretion system baseplate subunit TssF [Desulfobacteraceae bacterium]MBC2718944.1 type VI secretion system baseplate subunit TssF [Desulfobacteraceae bacterium]
MFNRYFQDELANLKELGADFSKAHPAVAPMLSGLTADPDVERLLEGVAFLTALLRQKLDDEFPEIIHELMQLIWPHYSRPLPSTTIVYFSPKMTLKQSMTIPAGIQIASVPIEGTSCLFKTCYDVEVHPLNLLKASFVELSGRPPAIKLLLELREMPLSDWQPETLRLYLAGDYSSATNLYFLLQHHLKQIVITSLDSGSSCFLGPENLKPLGFAYKDSLIPYPSHSFPGYRILQEYFILPEKFLFLYLMGWKRWQKRGDGARFEISFELKDIPFPSPKIKTENFVLHATPAINIFPHDADPIRLDHRRTEYLVRPSGTNISHYQVYSVEKVIGFVRGTAKERIYTPFELFSSESKSGQVYHVNLRKSPVLHGSNIYLSVAYPPETDLPESETLSIRLLCTNGSLPESLQSGDICLPTSSSPEYVEFSNIRSPTVSVLPPLGTNLLWRLLSHLSLNYISLAKAENLRALLEAYIFEESRDRTSVLANQKRIAGIVKVETKSSDRLVSGIMMRGQEIRIKVRNDHFAGQGDLFLFGCVLDEFLSSYASINTYTNLVVEEILKGDLYQWPARIGDHPLI